MSLHHEPWLAMLPVDPRQWILDAEDDPAACWITLTQLLDRPQTDSDVVAAHQQVLADPRTQNLLDSLTPWDTESEATGHDKPNYTPNVLSLLGDMGITPADDQRLSDILSEMLEHQYAEGRFQSFGRWRSADHPVWGAMLCDAHAITDTLARFGYAQDLRVIRSFERMVADIEDTDQGRAWRCRKDPAVGFRGPGRVGDFCPQVTLEALRATSYLSPEMRSAAIVKTGRVVLRAWRERAAEKPYMFGHGRNFKRAKWPVTWYGGFEVADTLGRFPELWDSPTAMQEDREALAEIAACLVAYNVGPDGRVTPRSAFKGFENHSFGQKKKPSPFATARTAVVLRRLEPLAADIEAVDVMALASSRGGTGSVQPP